MKCPKKGFKYGKTSTGQRVKYWRKGKTVFFQFVFKGTPLPKSGQFYYEVS
jgi:hypothetical protein